ncbi:hypothetical protein U0070_023570 [Myodes glareolus]|uniref:Apolipoprotein L3-like n=1 Tax=Myodes glareolus TaxID=447135 RepID=A0AAW0H0P1_MYOGA
MMKKMSRTDLKLLITEDGAWNAFVEEADLSSEEEAALREALKEHLAQEPTDENGETEKRQQKENFLKEFPELKRKLEENNRKLRALADHLDQVHRDCTISNVVSGSTSLAATIAGLALAPFTGGASLIISAASAGLGAAAVATGVTTTIVEASMSAADESEARRLVGASMDILDRILEIVPLIEFKLCSAGWQLSGAWKTLREHMQANRPRTSRASRNAKPRNIPPKTRGARIAKGVGTGLMFLLDVCNLVKDSMDLHSGAKTESAEALRDLAKNLEEKLHGFEQLHKALQLDLPQ